MFEKLVQVKNALQTNAASVQSDLGGGEFRHLGLILPNAKCQELTGHEYVIPAHPGH